MNHFCDKLGRTPSRTRRDEAGNSGGAGGRCGHLLDVAQNLCTLQTTRICGGEAAAEVLVAGGRWCGWHSGAGELVAGGGLDHAGRTGLEGAAEVVDAAPQLGEPCLRPNLIGGKLSVQKPELGMLKGLVRQQSMQLE